MTLLATAVDWGAALHGGSGLAAGFFVAQAGVVTGLRRSGAAAHRYLVTPVLALPATLAGGIASTVASTALGLDGSIGALAVGATLVAGAGYAAGRLGARSATADVHRRGARVVDTRAPAKGREPGRGRTWDQTATAAATRTPDRGAVTLAGRRVPARDETKHFKVVGSTGTGKSSAILELVGGALARGDRAIIADPDGGFMRRLGSPDAARAPSWRLLNPFEPGSLRWDPFGEIESPHDVDELARSLIPDPASGDRSWSAYARTFFTAVTRQAWTAGTRDAGELYRLLVMAPPAELRFLVAGTPAQPFLDESNSRMFDSIRSVTSSAVAVLEHVAAQRGGEAFSVRQWVRNPDAHAGQALFVPYRAGQVSALRSAVSAWMRLGIFEAMNRAEGDQRLWFVVDELDALGAIDGLKDALARLRKFGGRTVLGFQSLAQVTTTYGRGDASTILENCSNSLLLRSSGSEPGGTAYFASRLIGSHEVERTAVSKSRRSFELRSSTTRSRHVVVEPLVLEAEIERLPDLSGYLKFASEPDWRRVAVTPARSAGPAEGAFPRGSAADRWRAWRRREIAAAPAGRDTSKVHAPELGPDRSRSAGHGYES